MATLVLLVVMGTLLSGTPAASAQANSPAAGAPIVNGTAQASETLTVDLSGISDTDGLVNVTFRYQWISSDGTTDTDISDETNSAYIVRPWDLGKYIKVRVSFTDDAGNDETLTSVATAAVEASPNEAPTGAPIISGMAEVGQSLSLFVDALSLGIRDGNGMTYATFSYQWIRSDGTTDSEIPDANDLSYTLTDADAGKISKVRVSFTDDGANAEVLTSSSTTAVAARPDTSDLDAPTNLWAVWSQEEKGIELEWTAPEGTVTGYQILRKEEPATLRWWEPLPYGCTPLMEVHVNNTGNDATTYTDTDVAEGAIYTYSVRAINSEGVGRRSSFSRHRVNWPSGLLGSPGLPSIPQETTSDERFLTGLQYRPHGYWPSGGPGTPYQTPSNLGSTQVKGGIGLTWEAPQGEVTGYQILRRSPEQCDFGYRVYAEIANSTVTRWADRDVEAGTLYEYHIRAINDVGAGRLDRNSTRFRPGRLVVGPEPNYPATGVPTITGTAQVGETLTADLSGIADTDGLYWARFSYQWLSSRDTEIEGATSSTYTLRSSDANEVIKVRVTFIDDAGYEEVLTSEATGAVKLNVPATGAPTITGTVEVGEILTADTSGIEDEDGLDNVSYGYQWIRSDGKTEVDIDGATGATYTITATDVDKAIKLRVNFTDDKGSVESLTSSATVAVPIEVTFAFSIEGTTVTCDSLEECDDPFSIDQGESSEIEVELAIARSPSSQLYKFRFHIYQLEDSIGHYLTVEANDLCLGPGLAESASIEATADGSTGPFTYTDDGTIFELCPSGTYQLYVPWYRYNHDDQEYEYAGTFRKYFIIYSSDEADSSIERVKFITPLYPDTPPPHGDVTIDGTRESTVLNRELATYSLSISGLLPDSDTGTTDYVVRLRVIGDDGREVAWCHVGDVGYSYLIKSVQEDGEWAMQAHLIGSCLSHRWPEILRIELFNGSYEYIASEDIELLPRNNSPATGAPAISGTVQVGDTLIADTSSIADEDGLDNVSFSYQWIRNDGISDTDIQGATSSTYVPGDDDVGKTITVRVSFTDDADNEESLTSAATAKVAAKPNSPATGLPTISGTVQVGETLTADTSGIADSDGLDNAQFDYQWLADDAAISGVTASTYTLLAGDVGKAIKVKVSFTDEGGNDESLTSAATAAVAAADETNALTAEFEGVPDSHDGQNTFTFELRFSEEFPVSYRILKDDAFTVDGGEVTKARRLERDSITPNIRWEITVSPSGDGDVTITLPETTDCDAEGAICTEDDRMLSEGHTATVRGPASVNSPATGLPTISGTVQVGETLTADTSGIADSDGLDNAQFDYQWLADDAAISGATASTYTLLAGDVGKAIKVKVSFTDDAGNDESLTSAATAAVEDRSNSPATGAPTISGTARVGHVLTAGMSGIEDEDGLSNASFSYQWVRNDGSGDADIAGATGATYTLVDADEGKTVKVRVSFTDDAENEETLTSAATSPVSVAPPPLTASIHHAPESHNGQNSFTFELRFSEEPGPDFSYKTLRDYSFRVTGGAVTNARRLAPPGNVRWEIIVLPDSDAEVTVALPITANCEDEGAICTGDGRMLSPEVLLSVAGPLEEEEQTSAENTPATGVPAISGTAQAGETLTADTSGIADTDGLSNATFSYQWVRNDGSDDADIAGATGATYTLVDTDEGKTIRVRVSFTDDAVNEETLTSAPTATVQARPNSPATGAPTISGTARVGEMLTADTSGIADADGLSNATFSYQWIRNDGSGDADIAGATGATYTLVDADEGKTIRVRVAFVDDGGNEELLTGTATATVQARPNSPATGAPTISGTAQVGETLTADASGIEDEDGLSNTTFSYQWIRNDGSGEADIAGATGATYTLVDTDEGKTIRVRVAFVDDRGHQETRTSAATAAIVPALDSESETEEKDGPVWSATMTAGLLYDGYGYSSFAGGAGELSDTAFDLDGVTYTIKTVVAWGWMYIMLDRELPTDLTFEVDGARFNLSDASLTTYSYASEYRWSEAETNWSEGDNVQLALYGVE